MGWREGVVGRVGGWGKGVLKPTHIVMASSQPLSGGAIGLQGYTRGLRMEVGVWKGSAGGEGVCWEGVGVI